MKPFITLTAGHSNTDPGAVGRNNLTEAEVVTEMRNIVAHCLREYGIDVKTDGEGSTNLPLREAVKLIAGSRAAVELHCNAAANPKACGVEVLSQEKDKALAQKLAAAVAETLGTTVRGDGGWKPENAGQHSRLAYVRGGGLILELFFITNDVEVTLWKARKWIVGRAIASVLAGVAR